MAHGRRDYTWGVLQDSIDPGRYTVNFNDVGAGVVPNGIVTTVYTYTVPAGYKLFLSGVHVYLGCPDNSYLYVKKDAANIFITLFSTNYSLDLGSYGSIPYTEGEVLNVNVLQGSGLGAGCGVFVFGVLEELV